jgi:aminoglycoside phosphotransferase (APT) family kinase protein
VPGEPADRAPATRATEAADTLAAFLTALHQPAPDRAPADEYGRGGPLADRAEQFERQLASATELGLIPDPDAVRAVWEDAVAAPDWAGPTLWLHADLHPANVLTEGGTFCGVIDLGTLCAGDPAIDLAAPWILLPDGAADRFYEAYRPAADAATLLRARGWAVLRALSGICIGEAGVRGRPGGKATWGPPAHTALRRLIAASR